MAKWPNGSGLWHEKKRGGARGSVAASPGCHRRMGMRGSFEPSGLDTSSPSPNEKQYMSPTRAPTPCRYPQCFALVSRPGYCAEHQREADRRDRQTRGSAAERGYNRAWREISQRVLSQEPACRRCAKEGRSVPAVEVHHVVPVRAGGSNESANLEPLCKSCHQLATQRELRSLGHPSRTPRPAAPPRGSGSWIL
jgi:5-methylcytosine-specific restriction enzyme A